MPNSSKRAKPAPRTQQVVTAEDALRYAMTAHRGGQIKEAVAIYTQIIKAMPSNANALHYLGLARSQQGRSEEAEELMRCSIRLAPDFADFHNNLGLVLAGAGRRTDALAAYDRALELRPAMADALHNRGAARLAGGDREGAESDWRAAITAQPAHVGALLSLAGLVGRAGRLDEATELTLRAIAADPAYFNASQALLVNCYRVMGDQAKALEIIEEWLAHEPDNAIALHLRAANGGVAPPPRAADAYVAAEFDSFAGSFDARLKKLRYRAPDLIHGRIEALIGPPGGNLAVLDAGCGTGLCGPLVRPYAARLDGVDLSGEMLKRAQQLQVYDGLEKGELTAFIAARPASYDLIISADTLVYFGDLTEVSAAAFAALKTGGRLIFTVEEWRDGDAVIGTGDTYALQGHGRYCHRAAYVHDTLARAGFGEIELIHVDLRLEVGRPVAGLLVSAQRVD
jgi:predicted TPR repeat methyltransferase